jgi:hypothetical protein
MTSVSSPHQFEVSVHSAQVGEALRQTVQGRSTCYATKTHGSPGSSIHICSSYAAPSMSPVSVPHSSSRPDLPPRSSIRARPVLPFPSGPCQEGAGSDLQNRGHLKYPKKVTTRSFTGHRSWGTVPSPAGSQGWAPCPSPICAARTPRPSRVCGARARFPRTPPRSRIQEALGDSRDPML